MAGTSGGASDSDAEHQESRQQWCQQWRSRHGHHGDEQGYRREISSYLSLDVTVLVDGS
ncbi:MAG: hypothetical protein ACYCS7_13100 [Acidimicrobiales bacterium]